MNRKTRRSGVKRLIALASASAVGLLLRPGGAFADSYSWTGATNGTWGALTNWDDLTTSTANSGPLSGDTTDDLTFTGSTSTASVNVGTATNGSASTNLLTQVNSITFDSNTSAAFTLSAHTATSALTIGSGGISDFDSNASQSQTISENLYFPASVITPLDVTSPTTSSLKMTGTVTIGAAGTLSLTGGGVASITTLNLPGSATLAASNSTLTLPGFTIASNDTVTIAANGASGSVIEHNAINMQASGASIIFDGTGGGNISAGAGSSSYGVSLGAASGTITQQGGGTTSLAILNAGTTSGINVTGGTFIMIDGAGSSVPAFVGDTTISGGSTFEVGRGNGNPTFGFGAATNNISLDGGTIETNGSASGTFGFVQGIIVNSSSSLKIQGQGTGTIGMEDAGLISGTNSAVTLTIDASAVNGNNSAHVLFALNGIVANTFAGTIDYVGPVSLNPGFLDLNNSGGPAVAGNLIINGNGEGVSLGTPVSITGIGPTTSQNSVDQFSTNTTISLNSGFLNLGANTSSSILTYVQTGGTLSVNTGTLTANNFTIAGGTLATSVAGAGLIGAGASGGQFVFDTTNGNLSDPVVIGGSFLGGLSVIGGNTLTLTADNTFTGNAIIQQGTVSLTGVGSLAGVSSLIVGDTAANSAAVLDISGYTANSGSYIINAGQTLSGHGTIYAGTHSNSILISSGSTLVAGGSPGILSITGASTTKLSVAGGSNLVFDLSGSASNSDYVSVAGKLATSWLSTAPANLSLSNAPFTGGVTTATYELFSYGTYTGDPGAPQSYGNDITDDFNITGLGASQSAVVFDTGATGGQIDLAVTSVPEPASLSLLMLGGVGLLSRRRRKGRKPLDVSRQ